MDKNFLSDIISKLKKRGCDQSDIFFVKNFSIYLSLINDFCKKENIPTEKKVFSW